MHVWELIVLVRVMLHTELFKGDYSYSVYLQHDLAVMHVRLPKPELQQLHITNFPANTKENKSI